jgi:hypothetical protein
MAAPRTDDHEAKGRIEHEVEECMAAKVLPRDKRYLFRAAGR